jgi:hypothetical protein
MSRLKGFAALAVAGCVGLSAPVTAQQGGMIRVDLELVLAVDISQSMDYDEHSIQRQGYVDAFRHKDVVNAMSEDQRIVAMFRCMFQRRPSSNEIRVAHGHERHAP